MATLIVKRGCGHMFDFGHCLTVIIKTDDGRTLGVRLRPDQIDSAPVRHVFDLTSLKSIDDRAPCEEHPSP